MGPGSQLSQKKNYKLLKGGMRIFVLITYLFSMLGVPSLAVQAGVKAKDENDQADHSRADGFNIYLPVIMGGSGTLPEVIIIDHEEGILSGDWEGDNGGGYIGVSAGAALAGTDYGLWADSGEGTSQYAYLNFAKIDTDTMRLRFYIDVQNVTPDVGYLHIIGVKSYDEQEHICYIRLRYNGSQYYIQFDVKENGDVDNQLYSAPGSISTTAENYVEVMIVRAGSGQSNGKAYLWVNGSLEDSATNVNNDQQFTNLGFIEAGVFSKMGDWSGDLHIDEIKMNNTGEEIGPLGGMTGGPVLD